MERLHISLEGKKVGWDVKTQDDLDAWPEEVGRAVIDLHCDLDPHEGLPTVEGIAKVGTIIRAAKGLRYKAYLTLMPSSTGHFLRTYNYVEIAKHKK